jgi:hypothetical protein
LNENADTTTAVATLSELSPSQRTLVPTGEGPRGWRNVEFSHTFSDPRSTNGQTFDVASFVAGVRALGVTPHVAQRDTGNLDVHCKDLRFEQI